MPTISGNVSTRSKRLITKNKPNKNNTPLVIEEDCAICQEVLNDGQTPVTTLTNCNHKFHEPCINQWMNSGQANAHVCPLCRTNINQNQWPNVPSPTQQQQQQQQQQPQFQQHQTPEYERRLQRVTQLEIQAGTSVPFLGVVVCYNNKMYKGYLNTEFDLTTNATLGELKNSVLSQQNDIVSLLPRDFICTARNIASTVTRGLVSPITRQIQITNVHFTTPSQCSIPEFSDQNFNNDDNLRLGDIYSQYQKKIRDIYGSSSYGSSSYGSSLYYIRSVYDNYTEEWNPTGPDDPGYYRTGFFLDPNGPIIPLPFRAVSNYEQSSLNSIAWLCFTIDCARRGGKTRKNKKLKKTKKRNSKFLKKGKKSIKRKFIK